jgi:AraC-like DNA-binding protein
MVRVLVQGMRELGLEPPHPALHQALHTGAVATVPLALKRLVVAAAVQQGGLACLPLLGRGLHHYRHDPTHLALVSARSAGELFARWGRLERYIHSRHRCELLRLEPHQALLRHVARSGPPPLPAEDLVVLGLLAALLEAIGLQAVRAFAGGVQVYPRADTASGAGTAHWRLEWQGEVEPRPPAGSARGPALADLAPPASWPAPLADCAAALLGDLAHPLPLPTLATALGRAPRSLQRALAQSGLGYAALLAELRCRAAAWWLVRSALPIAEVGFVCGYADQPHFTRELRRRVGMTPARYRRAFGSSMPQRPTM